MELSGRLPSPSLHDAPIDIKPSTRHRRIWKRLAIAAVVVLVLHLLFFLFIAPHLEFDRPDAVPTEVVQITPQELAQLKNKILKNQQLNPLLEQEVHEEFRSKEAPKDPKMMGPFNQIVPEETIAGAQHEAPQKGGGGDQSARAKPRTPEPKKLDLKNLGLGTKVAPPVPQKQAERESIAGPRGPTGPRRPVGRDSDRLKKGSDNLLNAVESAFYSFFARFDEPIIRNWYFLFNSYEGQIRNEIVARRIKPGAELPVTIEMVLDRQGNFRRIVVVESSGVPILDQIARDAVKKLGSVPNPPAGIFEGKSVFVRQMQLTVHYVESGGPVNFQPNVYW